MAQAKKVSSRGVVLAFGCALLMVGCTHSPRSTGYRIAIDPTWYPLELEGNESKIYGFMSDILMEIAREENIQLTQVQASWDNLLLGVEKKLYDGAISSLPPYDFYQRRFGFSDSLLLTGPILIMRATDPFRGWDSFAGKEVAVGNDEDAIFVESYPGVIVRTYQSVPNALDRLVAGGLDAVVVEGLIGAAYVRDLYAGILQVVTPPLGDQGLRLVTARNQDAALLESFQRGLRRLREQGKYDALLQKWSLVVGP